MSRPKGFLAAAAFLAVIVILAVWLALSGSHHGSNRAAPSPPTAAPSSTVAPVSSGKGCRPADRDQQIPQSPPSGITWQLFDTVALPYSRTAGPLVIDGPIARCYAHTPLGALLAASQIPTRTFITSEWKPVVLAQVVASPGRDRLAAELSTVTSFDPPAGGYGQLAGFRFDNYDASTATIEFVTRFQNGSMQVTTTTVRWVGGDWKLQLQPDGSQSATAQPVSSLTGYVAWSGL